MDDKSIRVSVKHNFAWQKNIMCIVRNSNCIICGAAYICMYLPLHCDPPENHPLRSCLHHHHHHHQHAKYRTNNHTETVPSLARSKCTGVCECAARDSAEKRRARYSLSGLLGAPCGAAPGDTPPLPLPKAPSPRSESNGDRSPSAIPRARRKEGERRELVLLCYRRECVWSPAASRVRPLLWQRVCASVRSGGVLHDAQEQYRTTRCLFCQIAQELSSHKCVQAEMKHILLQFTYSKMPIVKTSNRPKACICSLRLLIRWMWSNKTVVNI